MDYGPWTINLVKTQANYPQATHVHLTSPHMQLAMLVSLECFCNMSSCMSCFRLTIALSTTRHDQTRSRPQQIYFSKTLHPCEVLMAILKSEVC